MAAGSDRSSVVWVLTLALLAIPQVARAQPSNTSAAATAQFDKGRELMKDKKYADACDAFERSQRLEAQPGTLYNLALCYVEVGKLATAWASFRELAVRDPNAGRRKASEKAAAGLVKRMPRLMLRAPNTPGLVVMLDGVDITSLVGTDTPVDLGTHTIEATAPKFNKLSTTTNLTDEGKTVTVELTLVAVGSRPPVDRVKPDPRTPVEPVTNPNPNPVQPVVVQPIDAPATPRSSRRRNAVIVGAAGGALLVTGVVFGRLASRKWDEAKAFCGEDLMCNSSAEVEQGNQLVDAARLRANVSTALVIGGVATLGIASYLYFTGGRHDTRSSSLQITPSVGPTQLGVVMAGRF